VSAGAPAGPATTPDAGEPAAAMPAALREPTQPVRVGWVSLLALAILGVFMAFFTPIQVLLPRQVEAIDPGRKEELLAWVTGLGALAAMVVNPVAGALSDRTTSRFGRRHPWTFLAALVGAGALVLLARQHTLAGVAIGWVVAQTCLNAMLASLTAAVPDRVPVTQRGAVSAWIGMPQVLGLVVGVVLVTSLARGIQSGYVAVAVGVIVLAWPFALTTRDDPLPRTHRARLRPRDLVTGMWISPRAYPDFAWAWVTRFLVLLGNALGTLYLLFFLTDAVKYPHPQDGLLVLILIYTGALILTTVVAGVWSDRAGRRKIFVIAAGLVMAVAAVILAAAPTWSAAMVAAAILGGGYGIYVAVDSALVTQVLPTATDRAKDLGVINIAASAPQVLAPAIAAPIVLHLGGYPTLYGFTALVTIIGSVLVTRIRAVP
jgi:MFS family permease